MTIPKLSKEDDLINEQRNDIEEWAKLIKVPEFRQISKYRDKRIALLNKEISFLGQEASQDSAIKILTLLARINEVKTWQSEANFMELQQRKLEDNKK